MFLLLFVILQLLGAVWVTNSSYYDTSGDVWVVRSGVRTRGVDNSVARRSADDGILSFSGNLSGEGNYYTGSAVKSVEEAAKSAEATVTASATTFFGIFTADPDFVFNLETWIPFGLLLGAYFVCIGIIVSPKLFGKDARPTVYYVVRILVIGTIGLNWLLILPAAQGYLELAYHIAGVVALLLSARLDPIIGVTWLVPDYEKLGRRQSQQASQQALLESNEAPQSPASILSDKLKQFG
jgi:hypothetical protein